MELRKNNLAELEKLLNKALNQVQQLQKTLKDINDFKIQVGQQDEFEGGKTDYEQKSNMDIQQG